MDLGLTKHVFRRPSGIFAPEGFFFLADLCYNTKNGHEYRGEKTNNLITREVWYEKAA